jgi:hypothetical protein
MLIASLALASWSAEGAAAMDVVLAAVAAEETAPRKQARLIFWIDDREIHYQIERVLPDRVHILAEADGVSREVIGIGTTLYLRGPDGWEISQGATSPAKPASLADLLVERLENLAELPPVVGDDGTAQRAFYGGLSWLAGTRGNVRHEGGITIYVETATSLLRRMVFEGHCGEQPCRFDHAIAYDSSVGIEAPE